MSGSPNTKNNQHRKVVLSGPSCGKTTIFLRITEPSKPLPVKMKQTIGCDFNVTRFPNGRDGENVLQMWDIAGAEKFQTVTRSFYRSADAILLVYSLNQHIDGSLSDTMAVFKDYVSAYLTHKTIVYLVGTCCDLGKVVTPDQINAAVETINTRLYERHMEFANEISSRNKNSKNLKTAEDDVYIANGPQTVKTFEVSGLENIGIEELFDSLKVDLFSNDIRTTLMDQNGLDQHFDVDVEEQGNQKKNKSTCQIM